MAWITLAVADINAALNEAELEAYTNFAYASSDPLPGLIEDVVQEVRGYVATAITITEAGIPHELKNAALDIIVWRLVKRCISNPDQQRREAAEKAVALLERVADGKHGDFGTDSAGAWGSDDRFDVRA